MLRLVKKIIAAFVVLIAIYVLSLTSVFMLPKSIIQDNAIGNLDLLVLRSGAIYKFHRETDFLEGPAGYVDALTDATMLTRNINFNEINNDRARCIQHFFDFPNRFADEIYTNPLKDALNANGYSRYWHGYQLVLRPLLLFFDYTQIRIFNIIWFALFSIGAGFIFFKRLGLCATFLLGLGLVMCKFNLIPLSMQFMNMFMLTFFLVAVAHFWLGSEQEQKIIHGDNDNLYLLCFMIGSLTAFFDFLTTPVLPIGVSLYFLLSYFRRRHNYEFQWKTVVFCIVLWGIGYLFTWASKWILCWLVLDINIFDEVIKQIYTRISDVVVSDDGSSLHATRALAVIGNVYALTAPILMITFLKVVFVLFLGVLLLSRYYPGDKKNNFLAQLLFIGLLPIVWYAFTVNHSYIHFWFTYRSLLVTVLCIGTYLERKVAWKSIFSNF